MTVMDGIKPKFVISAGGRREAVVLGMTDYARLICRLEDLEDALALDRAERSSKRLLDYSSVHKRLQRSGKL
jgi:hypothetical protein